MNIKNIRKPFLRAVYAVAYIVFIVFALTKITGILPIQGLTIPIVVLGLFVLSAGFMGFLFLYEPFVLYSEGKKSEATRFFATTLGFFACFVSLSLLVTILLNLFA